jgi:hypothetical protein
MLNFYRRFLYHAAATQTRLHDVLSSPSQELPPHHLDTGPPKSIRRVQGELVSRHSTGAPLSIHATCTRHRCLQVRHGCRATPTRQECLTAPRSLKKRKLNSAEQKYSAYDRELLANYEAVKHFHHILEARHFTIFTDHKTITYAFQQKWDKYLLRQFKHIDFVAQFTTDIGDISGQDNVVAVALSRVESVTAPPSYNALAASQGGDDELRTLLGSTTALRLEKLPIPGTTVSIYCDTSAGRFRTYVQPFYCSKCSSPLTTSRTQSPK